MRLVGVVDAAAAEAADGGGGHAGLPVAGDLSAFGTVDAVLVTDLKSPQETYERLRAGVPEERIFTPALLHIVRGEPADQGIAP